jgi:hypothetical protein
MKIGILFASQNGEYAVIGTICLLLRILLRKQLLNYVRSKNKIRNEDGYVKEKNYYWINYNPGNWGNDYFNFDEK